MLIQHAQWEKHNNHWRMLQVAWRQKVTSMITSIPGYTPIHERTTRLISFTPLCSLQSNAARMSSHKFETRTDHLGTNSCTRRESRQGNWKVSVKVVAMVLEKAEKVEAKVVAKVLA